MQETSAVTVYAIQIMNRVHDIARGTLRFGINRLFMIARSHYENIDLAMMSQGFAPGNSEAELEDIKESVAPWHRTYLSKLRMRSSS